MEKGRKALVRASLVMIATIVGAGTFALPAAFKGMGLLAGTVAYWIVALVILATNLLFVEVVLHSRAMGRRRLPGYMEAAFGGWAKYPAFATVFAQTMGACLAYLVLGGDFLASLAGHFGLDIHVLAWQLMFWAAAAAVVSAGLKSVARVEAWMTGGKFALLILCVAWFASRSEGTLFTQAHWTSVMPLIGVFLFSLSGWPAIPEVADLCGRDKRRTILAVASGSLASALIMWLFGVTVYAALGAAPLANPADFSAGMPAGLFWLIPAVGFLAVATPFMLLSLDFKETLHLDAKLPPSAAWAVTLLAPLVLLVLTTRDFLHTVEFVGAVITSLNALLICSLAVKLLRRERLPAAWRIGAPLVCGAAYLVVAVWKLASL